MSERTRTEAETARLAQTLARNPELAAEYFACVRERRGLRETPYTTGEEPTHPTNQQTKGD